MLSEKTLISFFECDEGITGSSLALIHLRALVGILEVAGSGNIMAGTIRGTLALSAQYPLALYLHCASHALNLVVVKSLQVASIRNMIGLLIRYQHLFKGKRH